MRKRKELMMWRECPVVERERELLGRVYSRTHAPYYNVRALTIWLCVVAAGRRSKSVAIMWLPHSTINIWTSGCTCVIRVSETAGWARRVLPLPLTDHTMSRFYHSVAYHYFTLILTPVKFTDIRTTWKTSILVRSQSFGLCFNLIILL